METNEGPVPEIPTRTRIAEADPGGGVLRYRGVDVDDLVGRVRYDRVWGLLVDDDLGRALPGAEIYPLPARTGAMTADVQSALATVGPVWGLRPLHDIDDATALADLARTSVLILSFVAQSARGADRPVVPQRTVETGTCIAERFLLRWRGEADPRHARALDAYFVLAAEHGFNAATCAARIVASTGAPVSACLAAAMAAASGPLLGGAPARVLRMLQGAERADDVRGYLSTLLDEHVRLMGFGHPVYRTTDPRAVSLKEVCRRLDAPLFEVAAAVEEIGAELLAERHPEAGLAPNIELWAPVLLHLAEVPPSAFTAVFAGARSAGWSAHILEQKRDGGSIRPVARYVGPAPRAVSAVRGWDAVDPDTAR